MDKQALVEALSNLTVLEMSELKTMLEETWGVEAAAPMAFAAAPAAAATQAAAVEESTDFKVTLEEAPAEKKVPIIKAVRAVTGLGLKEAKDLVESVPKVIKESAPKAEVAEIVKTLEEAGAKVSVKGL